MQSVFVRVFISSVRLMNQADFFFRYINSSLPSLCVASRRLFPTAVWKKDKRLAWSRSSSAERHIVSYCSSPSGKYLNNTLARVWGPETSYRPHVTQSSLAALNHACTHNYLHELFIHASTLTQTQNISAPTNPVACRAAGWEGRSPQSMFCLGNVIQACL